MHVIEGEKMKYLTILKKNKNYLYGPIKNIFRKIRDVGSSINSTSSPELIYFIFKIVNIY